MVVPFLKLRVKLTLVGIDSIPAEQYASSSTCTRVTRGMKRKAAQAQQQALKRKMPRRRAAAGPLGNLSSA